MKKIFFISLLSLSLLNVIGQNYRDSIKIRKGLGTTFIQNEKPLTVKQLMQITKVNTAAYKEMQLAKTNYDVATIFNFAGGFLIGWPLGTAIGGGEPNWSLAGIGAGLVIISIPFSSAYNKHATKAVNIFNRDLKQTAYKMSLNAGVTSNGIGIILTF